VFPTLTVALIQLIAGKNRRSSTKEESLAKAKEIAEHWYLKLRGKLRSGEIKTEKTFREVSEHYLHEYDIKTQGQRKQRHVNGQHIPSVDPRNRPLKSPDPFPINGLSKMC
jgi:hypothetical protein